MHFSIGDRVRVRSDLVVGNEYGDQYFNSAMGRLRGMTVTIDQVWDYGGNQYGYSIAESDPQWGWTAEMFEPPDDYTKVAILQETTTPSKRSVKMEPKTVKKIVGACVAVALLLLVLCNSMSIVTAGHTGVMVTLGRVKDGTLQEGLHLKAPFVQRIVKIDNRIQKLEVNTEAFSRDLQSVETSLAVNYRIDVQKSNELYKNVGEKYEEVLIVPAVNEVLKAITAKYTAEESVANRNMVSEGLVNGLNAKLNDAGLYVTDVNIINFDFSDAFIKAIEEKQVARQQLLKAETERKTKITNAKAQAEALKINAEAEAEANKKLAASLSDRIIENKKIEKWNGTLPKTIVGDESGVLFEIAQ